MRKMRKNLFPALLVNIIDGYSFPFHRCTTVSADKRKIYHKIFDNDDIRCDAAASAQTT